MCRVVECRRCHKPTWAGCGAHVERGLGHVPKPERCACREATSADASKPGSHGIADSIRRIFGR